MWAGERIVFQANMTQPDEKASPDLAQHGAAPAPGEAAGRAQERAARQQRLVELGELAGNLAHELKNPLSTLKLNLQLLQEDLAQAPGLEPSKNRLITLRKEADRLAQTLDNFLRFAGRMELQPASVRLNAVVQDLIDFFLPQASAHRVRLMASFAPEDPVVRLDVNLFKQALLNLLINGVQAMPDGGDLIVRAQVIGEQAILDVADTGLGISPQHQGRIFEAYFTTKKGGTGLGLATTRRIVEEHGGQIAATSEPGRGTNFRLEVPLSPQAAARPSDR